MRTSQLRCAWWVVGLNDRAQTTDPAKHKRARGERSGLMLRLGDEVKASKDEEDDEEATETVEVERATTEAKRHEEPRAEDTRHVDRVLAHCERVRRRVGETGLLEEVGAVVAEAVATEILDHPDGADDLRQGGGELGPRNSEATLSSVRTSVRRRSVPLKQSR